MKIKADNDGIKSIKVCCAKMAETLFSINTERAWWKFLHRP